MNYTKEQLFQKFQTLPEDIQNVMASVDTVEALKRIGSKHQLHVDKIGLLSDEIGLVMLGINKADDFVNHVADRLSVGQTTAVAIAADVNEQIFLKIRESLRALHEKKEEGLVPANLPVGETAIKPEIKVEEKSAAEEEKKGPTEEEGIFEQKMGKLFRIPREEVELDPYLEKPE